MSRIYEAEEGEDNSDVDLIRVLFVSPSGMSGANVDEGGLCTQLSYK